MKTVLLMRHAKSDWSHEGLSDHERPLNKRGLRSAPIMGGVMQIEGIVPQMIISSDAVRARQTAELVAEKCGIEEVRLTKRLYLADPSVYIDLLTEVPPDIERVLLVGHNPGIGQLVEILSGVSKEMPTAALARIDYEVDEIAQVDSVSKGELAGFFRPRDYDVG